jgi:hypothetical protein
MRSGEPVDPALQLSAFTQQRYGQLETDFLTIARVVSPALFLNCAVG